VVDARFLGGASVAVSGGASSSCAVAGARFGVSSSSFVEELMSLARLASVAAVVSLGSTLAACGNDAPAPSPQDGPSYFGAAKAVIDERCGGCHREGGIAPFSLHTFEEVKAELPAIRAAVERGSMPPWPADADCNDYANDRSLTEEERVTLLDWIDAGAPEGVDAGEPTDSEASGLSRVDLSLSMPTEYTPKLEPDDYRCFLIDWPEDATKFVTGFRANPGNAQVVHHVIAYVVPPSQVAKYDALDQEDDAPGYTCFGGPGGGVDQDTSFVGSWAPGSEGGDFPAGTGIRIEPGSKIALQVHYNTLAGKLPDRSSIDLRVDDHVEHEAKWQFFTNISWVLGSGMEIPPMSQDVEHTYATDPTQFVGGGGPITIHQVGVHLHTLGKTGRLAIERAAGDEQCLVDVPEWNFHWQLAYELEQATVLYPGDKLSIDCTWDNPTPNTVKWGEGTGDEMCLGLIYYTAD
jgi:mono/diheme cytochrome c family protein